MNVEVTGSVTNVGVTGSVTNVGVTGSVTNAGVIGSVTNVGVIGSVTNVGVIGTGREGSLTGARVRLRLRVAGYTRPSSRLVSLGERSGR